NVPFRVAGAVSGVCPRRGMVAISNRCPGADDAPDVPIAREAGGGIAAAAILVDATEIALGVTAIGGLANPDATEPGRAHAAAAIRASAADAAVHATAAEG